jgi:DNA-binding MarR family transcriptional regulator/ribosomal protein S18 acetylase RimI-like enzyme
MPVAAIARIRRFNRAVTTEVGALDASFLGRSRPLGEARLLCAIGRAGQDVSALRTALGLDSGLLSRLLRALERTGLVTVTSDPQDRRRRIAHATPQGCAEIDAYNQLSDARADRILAALSPDADGLLAAMDRITILLNRTRITVAETDPASASAQYCLAQYYAELVARFDAGFDPAVGHAADPSAMRPPRGTFMIARSDDLPIGCAALAADGEGLAEVKRLWVAPIARGIGLADRLMTAIETRARDLRLTTLRLDTNSALTEAIAFYRSRNWTEIPRYNANPYAHHWFAKTL